jgi:dGTP triphosphohydrolase
LKFIRDNHITIRTLDVQIVDIADEIAYAAHDLEDGLRVKAFTIDDILQEFWNRCNTKNEKKKLSVEAFENFENIVVEAKANAGYKKGTKITSSEYLQLFGKELASKIIYHAIHGVGMVEVNKQFKDKTNTKRSSELRFPENKVRDLVAGLKDIVFECINHTSDVYHYEQQGEKVIRYLANFYKKEGGVKYLPPEFRADAWEEYGKPKSQDRLTCDYIAGMMDSYAIELYEKYSGEKIQV